LKRKANTPKMEEEILDKIENNGNNNRTSIIRIIQISIATVFLFFLIEELRDFLPEYLLEWEGIKIWTVGLIIFGMVILNSIFIPTYLNKIKPELSILKIIIYTGLIIFLIEFAFKITQNILLDNFRYYYSEILINAFKLGGILGAIGMLIANISIHKIRKKSVLISVLLLVGIWILIGLLVQR